MLESLRRRWAVWSALSVSLVVAALVIAAPPASAAGADVIDSFTIDFRVETTGVMHVKETIVYRFGSTGRHGIERALVAREKYDDQQDQVYDISNIAVDSPSGAPDEFTTNNISADHGRSRKRVIRIGDPDETLYTTTATYVIEYDVTGALRTSGSYDELYWDATGFDWDASINQVKVTATVPGGVADVRCYQGVVGSTEECATRQVRDGVAVLGAQDLAQGAGVTIGIQIKPGLVANPQPQLARSAAELSPVVRTFALAGAGLGGLTFLAVLVLAWRWWRLNGRDQRYQGIPPGTVPLAGTSAKVGWNDRKVPVPVAFSPPKISVAEAGALLDAVVDSEETAATLVDLAVRGAITLRRNKSQVLSAARRDIGLARAPHERALLDKLFADGPVRKLNTSGSLAGAAKAMEDSLNAQLAEHGWLRPRAAMKPIVVVALVSTVLLTVSLIPFGAIAVLGAIPVLLAIAFAVFQAFRETGGATRTAAGRAMCDQVEGFRTYLATAEADQLKFEEGEDIFSRYLPWAIVYDLADRWERICADLVAMGRLPDGPPSWFEASGRPAVFHASEFTSSVSSASGSGSISSGGSTGTGTGGGSSSFSSSGGYSGGGGGGGGGGSW